MLRYADIIEHYLIETLRRDRFVSFNKEKRRRQDRKMMQGMTKEEVMEAHDQRRRHQLHKKQQEMLQKKMTDFHHCHHIEASRFHDHHDHDQQVKPPPRFRVDQSVRRFDQHGMPVRFPKIRKGEEKVDEMVTQMKGLRVGGIRRLNRSVEDRKREKRRLTQYEMGKVRLSDTSEQGCQTMPGCATSADPSVMPYRSPSICQLDERVAEMMTAPKRPLWGPSKQRHVRHEKMGERQRLFRNILLPRHPHQPKKSLNRST